MEKIKYKEFLDWKNDLRRSDTLLDVGCWDGKNTEKFAKLCNAYGVEIDRDKMKEINPGIRKKIKWGDVTKNIPFKMKFDYAYMGEVLEHVNDDEKAIKNIASILKKGGRFVFTTPNSIPFFNYWDPAWIRWKLGLGNVHRHYSVKKLEKTLSGYGLKIEKYAIGWGLSFILYRWINILSKHVFHSKKVFGTEQGDGYFDLCVIAKKM